MRKLNPQKVFVQYRDRMNPNEPIINRKYTITHSDTTAELFVFIAKEYAIDQITNIRDEVTISWQQDNEGFSLIGFVMVDGTGIMGNSLLRNNIFLREMPTALQALRQADRFLFYKEPSLDNASVYIHFISTDPTIDKIYDFGAIGLYK